MIGLDSRDGKSVHVAPSGDIASVGGVFERLLQVLADRFRQSVISGPGSLAHRAASRLLWSCRLSRGTAPSARPQTSWKTPPARALHHPDALGPSFRPRSAAGKRIPCPLVSSMRQGLTAPSYDPTPGYFLGELCTGWRFAICGKLRTVAQAILKYPVMGFPSP